VVDRPLLNDVIDEVPAFGHPFRRDLKMARPIYPHELADADYSWLMNSFRENNPHYAVVESSCRPVVLIQCDSRHDLDAVPAIPAIPSLKDGDPDPVDAETGE